MKDAAYFGIYVVCMVLLLNAPSVFESIRQIAENQAKQEQCK